MEATLFHNLRDGSEETVLVTADVVERAWNGEFAAYPRIVDEAKRLKAGHDATKGNANQPTL